MTEFTKTFASRLEQFGDAIAIVSESGEQINYLELAARADAFGECLGAARRLLLIEAANEVEPLVAYLGALRQGHPTILAAGESPTQLERIIHTYRPDVRFHRSGGRWQAEMGPNSDRDLHPDLALLLSTSGSTGAAKLVRLSHAAVEANAQSIVEYLGITPADRAITTLPIHYSYGLSVVASHLAAGARLLLTKQSVKDEGFWTFFEAEGATSLAGVPATYELLDRIGLRQKTPPSLNTLTQAGGRLPVETVIAYGEWAKRVGVKFFVMYGQTEATARMAYVPPERLLDNPGCIGTPIPGGSFLLIGEAGERIDKADTPGELVYSGPNIMMGYAVQSADLAKGHELAELETGDLAVRTTQGLYRIVGRKSRFSKLFGLRISLDEVEATLTRSGVRSVVAGDDELIAIAAYQIDSAGVIERLASEFKLPASVFSVVTYAEFPTLSSGKFDYQEILRTAKAQRPSSADDASFIEAFRRTFPSAMVSPSDSFISLGGDSLSYVRLSLDIEGRLGFLPARWEEETIGALDELAPRATRPSRHPFALRGIESEVVIRAAAILAVVANHASSYVVGGGAHVLLMLSGYNFSRYQKARLTEGRGVDVLSGFFKRIIVPYYAILGLYLAVKGDLNIPSLLLVSNFQGRFGSFLEPYWFLEALLQCTLIFVGLFALPSIRRMAAKSPWAFGLALLAGALSVRIIAYVIFQHRDLEERTPDAIFYMLAFGWCLHQATTPSRRILLSLIAVAIFALQLIGPENIWGRFDYPSNVTHAAWFLTSAILIMWAPRLVIPNLVHGVVGMIAAASFYIYLTHGVPVHLLLKVCEDRNIALLLALPLSVVIGLAVYKLAEEAPQQRGRLNG